MTQTLEQTGKQGGRTEPQRWRFLVEPAETFTVFDTCETPAWLSAPAQAGGAATATPVAELHDDEIDALRAMLGAGLIVGRWVCDADDVPDMAAAITAAVPGAVRFAYDRRESVLWMRAG